MTYIEGIGDEVIQFLIVLVVIIFATLAWWSTSTTDRILMRTVYIVEHHSRSSAEPMQPLALTQVQNDTGQNNNAPPAGQNSPKNDTAPIKTTLSKVNVNETPSGASQLLENCENEPSASDATNVTESNQTTLNDCEADSLSNVLRLRRIAFFQGSSATPQDSSADNAESESHSSPSEMKTSSSSDKQTAPQTSKDFDSSSVTSAESKSSQTAVDDGIKIKLKYLNEDQKLVDGRRTELLGSFKSRHFSAEISANKVIKLIFNGQLLLRDADTLESCGLYNNCVVHCLIHASRNSQQSSANNNNVSGNSTSNQSPRYINQQNGQAVSEWRLGSLLYFCISFILSFCWYCRFYYTHLFTVSTTVALAVSTFTFLLSLFSVYIPNIYF